MTHLDDMHARVTAALEGTGVRGVIDPASAVAPCLLVGYVPSPLRQTACGWVYAWDAILIPPRSTKWLAAQWLAEHRQAIRDALDSVGRVTEEEGIEYSPESDVPLLPAYIYTLEAT